MLLPIFFLINIRVEILRASDGVFLTDFRLFPSKIATLTFTRITTWHGLIQLMVETRVSNGLSRKALARSQRIVLLTVPPVEELDLIGPVQVFGTTNRLLGKRVYQFEIANSGKELLIRGESGLSLVADAFYRSLKGEFDSLLIVCGVGSRLTRDAALFDWMRNAATKVRRLGAVCVGSFLLAQAGLLDGRRATAHWKCGREMAKRFPKVKVESEPVWVKDGNIFTSAGISAGIDLALAWVEEDFGSSVAHEVARELVLFVRRPAGQTQVSVSLSAQASEVKTIQQIQVWMAENLHKKLSAEILAKRAAMSLRNFERVFAREVGLTPARYILRLRVESARRQLEQTERAINQIALLCGFGGADVMRRAFVRSLAITPSQYRNKISIASRT